MHPNRLQFPQSAVYSPSALPWTPVQTFLGGLRGASELLPIAQTDPVQTSLPACLWVSLPAPNLGPLKLGMESENIKRCSRSHWVKVEGYEEEGIELNGRPAGLHTGVKMMKEIFSDIMRLNMFRLLGKTCSFMKLGSAVDWIR